MQKRTLFLIIIIVLIILFNCKKEKIKDNNADFEMTVSKSDDIKNPLKMGYGWSINNNEDTAVAESIQMMLKQIEKPVFVMVINTAEYNNYKIHESLRKRLGHAKFLGINSYKYVITPDGFHRGDKGAIALLGLESDKVIIGTAVQNTPDPHKVKEITKILALQAVEDAGKTAKDKPVQIQVVCADTPEEKVVEVLTDMFGIDIPIIGGTSADDKINKGVEFVYNDKKITGKGISIAILYADEGVKAGNAFVSGYTGSKKSGIVTSVREFTGEHLRVIEEIDNRPAGEVYNEWTGNLIADRLKNGESIFAEGHMHPLAVLKDFKNKKQYLTLCPGKVDPITGGLHVFANPNLNDKIIYMEGSVDALIKRMQPMIINALLDGKIKKKNIAGAYIIYCRGAFGALDDRYEEIYNEVLNAMDGKPFILALTAGEIGHIPGHGNFHGNLMTTAVVFSK